MGLSPPNRHLTSITHFVIVRASFVNLKDCTDRKQGAELLSLGIPESTAGGMLYGSDANIASWSLSELFAILPVSIIVLNRYTNKVTAEIVLSLFFLSGFWHCVYEDRRLHNILFQASYRRKLDAVFNLCKSLSAAGYDFRNHFAFETSITMDGANFCGGMFKGYDITFFKHYEDDTDNAEENNGDDSI